MVRAHFLLLVFRVNHWQTLTEISGLCGEKERIRDGVWSENH